MSKHRQGERHRRLIKTTFDKVTPESAAEGDVSDRGWIDEEGEEIALDSYDREEGITIAKKAANWLRDAGASEASSTRFHKGVWYSTEYGVTDYRTGEEEQRSFHLKGFTGKEERQIFDLMNRRR